MHLEQMTALTIIEMQTVAKSQNNFMVAEVAILDCEKNINQLSALAENSCFIQPIGKQIWKITSKQKPMIETHVYFDEKTGLIKRLNWRQAFE
jgi:hypothetical protein